MPSSSAIRGNGGGPDGGAALRYEASAIRYSADHAGARVPLTLSGILERHQPLLALHGREVSGTCALLGRGLGFPEAYIERIALAGALWRGARSQFDHDVVEAFATNFEPA